MRTDVLIIGGGIMGAVVAAAVRRDRPDVDLTIVDTGPRIGDVVGLHLHDVTDDEVWRAYNALAGSGSQAVYVGAQLERTLGGTPSSARPGMYDLAAFGGVAPGLPGAAIAWNAGGMGVHWTAATPTPHGTEVPGCLAPDEWRRDLERAQQLLDVRADPYGPTPARGPVLSVLDAAFGARSSPGRGPQPMPMALHEAPDGRMVRTGPSTIFPALSTGGDKRTHVLTETTCLRIEHTDGRATGAVLRGLRDGDEFRVEASAVVVAADALRSPQLLWASQIRPTALGTHLNEHAMLTGRALLDHDRFGLDLSTVPPLRDREWNSGSSWLPMSGPEQPFQAQLMETAAQDEHGVVTAYHVGLTWYVPTAVRPENRIEFSEERDPVGLPAMRIHFELTDADRAAVERARVDQARIGHALGAFDPEHDTAVLPAGSSLHMTGTVRMGATDDGTSVCDPDGLVWGTENVFVAGNGVLPTALAANSTLAGSVTAVRAARRVAHVIEGAAA